MLASTRLAPPVKSTISRDSWRLSAEQPPFVCTATRGAPHRNHRRYDSAASLQLLAPQSVLLVLHLATVYLKTAITPMDLIGQSVSGELPFYKAISNASMRLDPERKQRLWKYFSPIGDAPCCVRMAQREFLLVAKALVKGAGRFTA